MDSEREGRFGMDSGRNGTSQLYGIPYTRPYIRYRISVTKHHGYYSSSSNLLWLLLQGGHNQTLCLYYSARICKIFCENKGFEKLRDDAPIMTLQWGQNFNLLYEPLLCYKVSLTQNFKSSSSPVLPVTLQVTCPSLVPQTLLDSLWLTTCSLLLWFTILASLYSAILTWGGTCKWIVKLWRHYLSAPMVLGTCRLLCKSNIAY